MNNAELDARLRAANPVVMESIRIEIRRSLVAQIGRVTLALLAAMSLGVGVAWAATGQNPVDSLFSSDLDVSRSGVGSKSFSSLQPMTQESLDRLPPDVAQMAMFRAIKEPSTGNRSKTASPHAGYGGFFEPDPANISAFANVQTNLGTPTILLVVDDQICSFSETSRYETGNCSTLSDVRDGGVVNWRSETANPALQRLEALFDDRVAAVDILEDEAPPVEVESNVLELRNLEQQNLTLVGFDNEGDELFRSILPLNEHK